MNQQAFIDSSITFESGILYTDSLLTLKATATTTGASNLSFVDGTVKKIGNSVFVFPVGDDGFYSAIEISAPSVATDAFIAQYHLTNQIKGENIDTTIRLLNSCSYWDLTRNAGSSNVYVSLYWDSIGCGLYDTLGLVVSTWDGSSWKNIGNTSTTGNVLSGKVKSGSVATSYSTFTWANKLDPGIPVIIPITPTLVENNDLEWNHSISEDYFGYNGSSVLDPGQNWSDLGSDPANSNLPVLLHNGISNLRINGGTNGNFWDWRTGWFIPENELPDNLFYTRSSHKKEFNSTKVDGFFVNDMAHIKTSNDAVASRPIFQFNVLTSSGFNYEVASLYRAHELNLPVKYVELGNEFYLSDEEYREVFPSSFDYISNANTFTQQLKSLAPFEFVKVAVVGTSFSDNSAGRRSNWLNIILAKISTSGHRPDAITIHEYYSSGLTGTQLFASNIGKMFLKPFDKCKDLFENEIQLIKDKNLNSSLTPPLEVWLTEYNMNDDLAKNVGTWAHGLFNAIQTLKYLESPLITHTCSHAMTSDVVYGNIFESDRGFKGLTQNQLPFNVSTASSANFATTKFGFTASGAANNEIALAMKGNNVIAHKIDFSSNANDIGYITYIGTVGQTITSTEYLNLYGWSFEKEEGFEAVILNLGNRNYSISSADLTKLTSFNSNTTIPLSMVQLTCFNPTAGISQIYGPTSTGTKGIHHLKTTGEIDILGDLILPPYSLTRIIYRNPNTITVRLTDDEICEGTTTSILVQGANHSATITLNLTPSHNLSNSDSLFILPNNLAAGTYYITATDGNVTSDPVTLIVHPAMSVTASITSGSDIPCADHFITLTADITTSSSDINNDYTYLWVPDKHIQDNNPFQQNIVLNNSILTTEAYQVFVYDGQCWASSNIIEFDRGPVSIDLGEDFTVCYTNDFDLRALATTSPLLTSGTLHYKWLVDNVEIPNETSPDISESTNLAVGTYTYRVEVWSDNGIIENENCPQWDEIEISVVNCCSCSNSVEISSHRYPLDPNIEGPVYNISHEEDLIDAINNLPGQYNVSAVVGGVVTISPNINNPPPPICINGEFWIRYFNGSSVRHTIKFEKCTLNLGQDASIKVRGRAKLIFEGCVATSCNTNMWDGIYIDIENQALAEPELEITLFGSIPTKIMNAKNGVVARRESPFVIEDCVFDNNYKDILLEKYYKSGLAQTATIISGCTFSSSGTLLAPYGGDKKFTAIELNEIEGRTIGDVTSANSISNSMYGIYSRNASFTLFKTNFNDILYDALFTESGTGIYATSDYDYTNRKITLGNGNSNGSNTFLKSKNGFVGVGEMNYYIYKNIFGNGTLTDRLLEHCIKIKDSYGKEILIENQNKFYDYKYGIEVSGITTAAKINVLDNKFFNANITNGLNFDGTAININNQFPLSRVESGLIQGNQIGSISPSTESRIGIHLRNVGTFTIQNNDIFFHQGASPSFNFRGIRLENVPGCLIAGNEISNSSFTAGASSTLLAIRVDASSVPKIKCNTISNMGWGMQFVGNNDYVSLIENGLSQYDLGIQLGDGANGAFIGNFQGVPGIGLDNSWSDDVHDRVEGLLTFLTPMPWYHHGDELFSNLYAPVRSNNTYSIAISPVENQTGYLDDPCNNILPIATERNYGFIEIAEDTARYSGAFANEYLYMRKESAYKFLTADTGRIILGYVDDEVFEVLYETLSITNIAKFDSVVKYCSEKQWAEAEMILENISDTNTHEHYLKQVLAILIEAEMEERAFDNEDSSILLEIANLHSLEGGLAVKIARNALHLEIEDVGESGLRIFNSTNKPESPELHLWPNPACEKINVNRTKPVNYQIYDSRMRLIKSGTCVEGVILTHELLSGYYLLFVNENSISYKPLKFCIIK